MTPRFSAYDNWLSTDKAMESAQAEVEYRDDNSALERFAPTCAECGVKYVNLVNGVNLQVCHRCEEGTHYED